MLLAADWQNPLDRLDVNGDGMLAPIDALVISNQLPAVRGSGEEAGGYIGYPDVNGDGVVDETDMNTVVAYVNTMPTSSSGGSSTAPSSGGSSSSSSSSMYGGISMSAPATLTVNEAQQFELTFSWTEAYWIVIDAPGLSFGSVIEDGYYAMMDSNGDPFVFQSYVGNTTAGQATLTAAFPDDGASPGNGTASDVMPITITAYGYYNMSAAQTTDVTVNNVDPVLTTTLLTPSTIEEGDEAQIEIHWSDAYWYEGELDRLTLEIDWGEGAGSQAVDPSSLEGCNSGNPFIGCAIAKHVYLDDNPTNTASDPYTIAVTLSDDDTGSVTNTIPLTVNNAVPIVTIDLITPIDRVLATDANGEPTAWLNLGQLDESERFTVTGAVTDRGINDTHTATLEVDLNFDGDFLDIGESLPVVLQPDLANAGRWTFSRTVTRARDDGPSPGNDTKSDSLVLNVSVEDDDTGVGAAASSIDVHNVAPRFTSTPTIEYEFDDRGYKLNRVTVSGSFDDVGIEDTHTIQVALGNLGQLRETLPIGVRQFSVTYNIETVSIVGNFGDPGTPDFLSIFPIVVEVLDDDTGLDSYTHNFSCSDVIQPAIPITGIQHVGGRGLFDHVEVLAHDPGDGYIGADFGMYWYADKRAFIGKGVCKIGVVQIAKTDSHYWGVGGELQELFNNLDWHIDQGVPYPLGWGPATSDNPFSVGVVSSQDSPGLLADVITFVGPSWLQHATQEFESCVVAIEGAEGIEVSPFVPVPKIAVYGCVTWSYRSQLQADGTYKVWRTLFSQTTDQDSEPLFYEGAGNGPSAEFKDVLANYFNDTNLLTGGGP